MKVKVIFLVIFLFWLSCSLFSQNPDELITQGDQLYAQMKDMATAKQALEKYRAALTNIDSKYEALWRISRILYFIGVHTESKKEMKSIFSQGIYYGKKAIDENPDKPEAHYWLGVNYGKYGETRGVLKSLSLVGPIKEEMNKVIEINRTFEDGGADRVLGRVYFKLPGFAGGSKKKSLEHLLKSKEIGPNDSLTRLYLADTYIALKQFDKAREEIDFILGLDDNPHWISDVAECKKEAKEMLQRKEFRKR